MMTSPDAFSIISKFWFSKLLGGKDKKWPKMSVSFCISGTVPHMIMVFGVFVEHDYISSNFFSFFSVLIFLGE